MGLFSFIKNAGAKVFGYKTDAEKAAEAAAVSAAGEAARKAAEAAAALKIRQTILDLELKVEDLKVSIDDDVATVTGKAYDTTEKEKIILVVGNSEGIATVDDRMEVEHELGEATFHTVEKGDTLSKIAKAVYGDAMKYPVIFEANKPMLKHPDKIYPGQVLRIPALEK
ncbi:peptidoglycan-binding protein LysM [Abyssalbus ytuae]|uniref:Potassium binding protein Kbp n=1 Tax=Abyssalbus ytuae TaxID=2926907 RepID=A0A9E7A3H3_9FLAO|nr:peptidoglycan-binding protein LysM [Abyssalbus ytuae]UOB19191.1 peptidoglycan-binding protein LysM [Abyssalbus ytuae]